MSVLLAYISEGAPELLELELQMVVSYHMDIGT